MKIDELIQELEEVKKEYGNLTTQVAKGGQMKGSVREVKVKNGVYASDLDDVFQVCRID